MKIPDTFLTVVKKLYPEIDEINVERYSRYGRSDVGNYYLYKETFFVHVNITFTRNTPRNGSLQDYSDKLNTAFVYTFPDMDFVHFQVNNFKYRSEESREELFIKLFEVEPFEIQ